MTTLKQHNPPHPGELIYRTYIAPFKNISDDMIAHRLGITHNTFTNLLNGKASISTEMAIKLSQVLGGTPESWLTLQDNYDQWITRKENNSQIKN